MTTMTTKTRKNFFMIDNDFIELYAKHLGALSVAVYSCLSKYADGNTGRCWPSMETMAEQLKIHRRTVSKALKKLQDFNIIQIQASFDRKLRKRKNNTYQLVPKEFWRDLPEEYDDDELPVSLDDEENNVTYNAIDMASSAPILVTESASNKTHIIKPNKENSLCGTEPTKPSKGNTFSKASPETDIWNHDEAIYLLKRHPDKDYQIIGMYFDNMGFYFKDRSSCLEEIRRNVKAAKSLISYKISDIQKTMKWLDAQDYDEGWSLEAVSRYIED